MDSPLNSLTVNGAKPGTFSGSDVAVSDLGITAMIAKEWRLGNSSLTPYLGARFSSGGVDFGTVNNSGITVGGTTFLGFSGMDIDSDDNVGAIVGTEYQITHSVALNVEGRFIDETAVTGALAYRF